MTWILILILSGSLLLWQIRINKESILEIHFVICFILIIGYKIIIGMHDKYLFINKRKIIRERERNGISLSHALC